MLLETNDGYIPSSRVLLYRPKTKGRSALVYYRENGKEVASACDMDEVRVMYAFMPVVPATPGFFKLTLTDDGQDGYGTFKQPIVAWRIDDDNAIPVVLESEIDKSEYGYILCPDGQVMWPYVEYFNSEKDWFNYAVKHAREQNARATPPHTSDAPTHTAPDL